MKSITQENINAFKLYLINEEKSQSTINKYVCDINKFLSFIGNKTFSKKEVLEYKNKIMETYKPTSVNSFLSSLNKFFEFLQFYELRVKNIKIQRQIFSTIDNELSKDEYLQLLRVAKKNNERLYILMQTICSLGIRVSEVIYITVEAVTSGIAIIDCKGKNRYVFLPNQLCKILRKYIKKIKIKNGPIFVTRNGKPLNRSNIWYDMKKLCEEAKVPTKKVFPHNLRHLFARTYYSREKDVVKLADILGHSSINTTRIYTMDTGETVKKQIENLGLVEFDD